MKFANMKKQNIALIILLAWAPWIVGWAGNANPTYDSITVTGAITCATLEASSAIKTDELQDTSANVWATISAGQASFNEPTIHSKGWQTADGYGGSIGGTAPTTNEIQVKKGTPAYTGDNDYASIAYSGSDMYLLRGAGRAGFSVGAIGSNSNITASGTVECDTVEADTYKNEAGDHTWCKTANGDVVFSWKDAGDYFAIANQSSVECAKLTTNGDPSDGDVIWTLTNGDGGTQAITADDGAAALIIDQLVVTPASLPGSPVAGQYVIDSDAANAAKSWDGSAWDVLSN